MTLEIIPDGEPTAVSLDSAKLYLKAIGNGEDDVIALMIEAAQSKVEKAIDQLLIVRACRFTTDAFGSAIVLPVRPVQDVKAVRYSDTSGVEQTLDASMWKIVDRHDRPRIVPAPGQSFPSISQLPGSVIVEFTAGYGNQPSDVPSILRIAVLKTVRDMWSFRGDMATAQVIDLPHGVQDIVDDYRRWVA